MPTAFAHALTGGALSAALPGSLRTRRVGLALAAVAVLPDADVAGFWLGVPYGHPLGHRGFSHSLPFALAVGLAAAALAGGRSRSERAALAVAFAASTASHGVLDAFNDGGRGIGFWIPFSQERFFAPFRPIMTSSLDPVHAFGPRGLRVLANEAAWLGPPLLLWLAIVAFTRGLARRRRASRC